MARARMADVLRKQIIVSARASLSSAALHKAAADACRANRDELIASGRASSTFRTAVDGRVGADEESVNLDGGIVRYVFSYLAQAVAFALEYCQAHSPVRSGAYRDSWAVRVNGEWWTRPAATIQPGSTVEIVNTMPYARKIDTGGQITSVPPGIVEAARQAAMKQYPTLKIARKFLSLSDGRDARGERLPYILKAQGIESGLTFSKKSGFERLRKTRRSNRKDRQAGQVMTYPALVLTEPSNG